MTTTRLPEQSALLDVATLQTHGTVVRLLHAALPENIDHVPVRRLLGTIESTLGLWTIGVDHGLQVENPDKTV